MSGYHKNSNRQKNRWDIGSAWGCLVLLLIGLYILPFVGLGLLTKKDDGLKVIGIICLIIGIAFWISRAA